jgi:hypothetical protein
LFLTILVHAHFLAQNIEKTCRVISKFSLHANPLARSPGQAKLASAIENYERICLNNFFSSSKFGFLASR